MLSFLCFSESLPRINDRLLRLLNTSIRTNQSVEDRINDYLQQRQQQSGADQQEGLSPAAAAGHGTSPGSRWTSPQRPNHGPASHSFGT